MSVGLGPREERFARALAAGTRQGEAYRQAGFRNNPAGASRLAKKRQIAARVYELQTTATERAIAATAVTKERVIAELALIAFAEIGSPCISVELKRKALVDLAKVAGFMVERREVSSVDRFDHLSDAQLRDIVEGRASALGRRRA